MLANLLSNLLENLEKVDKLIDSGEIEGIEYGLFTFTEEREVIADLMEDIKEGISIAHLRDA